MFVEKHTIKICKVALDGLTVKVALQTAAAGAGKINVHLAEGFQPGCQVQGMIRRPGPLVITVEM